MSPERAIKRFWYWYARAQDSDYVKNKTAWALHQTWKEADVDKKEGTTK